MNQEEKIRQIDQTIIDYYSKKAVSDSLVESILSVQAGGKRIQAFAIIRASWGIWFASSVRTFSSSFRLEMIHTGSLIHDDLSCNGWWWLSAWTFDQS